MSYSMTIQLAALPPVAPVLASLGDAVKCREALDATWPTGTFHLHRVGASSRGVELIVEPGEVRARMVSFANLADWELAFELLAALGAHEVVGEDGTSASVGELRHRFAEVLVRENAAAAASLIAAGKNPDAEIRIPGPVRPVYLGPRMLAELAGNPGAGGLALLERIRRIQYIEREGFEREEDSDVGAAMGIQAGVFAFAIWNPGRAQAFGPTGQLGVAAPGGNLHLPVAVLPALLDARFEWLDEKQFAIAATPTDQLPALFAAAARVAIDPYADLRATTKKWWQFWK